MSARFLVTETARRNLRSIERYLLLEAGSEVVREVRGRLFETFEKLAKRPGMGHRRADLTGDDVRFWSVYSYLIVYRERDPIEILRVYHAKRVRASPALGLDAGALSKAWRAWLPQRGALLAGGVRPRGGGKKPPAPVPGPQAVTRDGLLRRV
jgi:plasmid stabilization system protein ParE